MDLIAINFEDEMFNNLCGGFESMVQREPTVEEAEEIFKLTLLLYSYSEDVPTYELSDFFVLSNALTYTGVELGLTDLASHISQWAGIYQFEEDYFFIHSLTEVGKTTVQVNLLSCFVTTAPLFVATPKPPMISGCILKKCMIRFTRNPNLSRR